MQKTVGTKALLWCVILLAGMPFIGCDDDDNDSGDSGDADADSDTDVQTDCGTYWDPIAESLSTKVTITLTIPEEYAGPTNPYGLSASFSESDDIPIVAIPAGMCDMDENAEIVPGGTYTYTSMKIDRSNSWGENDLCGEAFYAQVALYETSEQFPTGSQWVWISKEKIALGAGDIVITDAVLVPNQ